MSELPIEMLIEKLGYVNSKNLIKRNMFSQLKISAHTIKTLNEINPYAVYMIDNKPFIFFIDSLENKDNFKSLSKQIWNAQIPITFLCDENTVKIYNGKSLNINSFLIDELQSEVISECSENSSFSYFKISDPLFWEQYMKNYSGEHLNDHLLLNITTLTDKLKNEFKIKFATKLVLRLIFIRYLIDRGVDLAYKNFSSNVEESQKELLNITKNKIKLYGLFKYLKLKFNGNLFELGNEINDSSLNNNVFNLLSDFLSGNVKLNNGQMSLFSLYDFNIIPVELISNIYEILLGKEIRKKDNAFYTPNYLAEYILDKTTTKFLKENRKYKILDPSCGSGVFLVNSFRRIVEENLGDNLYCDNDVLLKELLMDNIYGVDINEDAIDVTIFSLYLTVLDYKDPKTLSEFTLPNLKGNNLIVSDFFDDDNLKKLKGICFDFIIGNPPWGRVTTGKHFKYCSDNGYNNMQYKKEISKSFIFRVKDFSSVSTVCCLVLHSKLLYIQKEPSKRFRSFLLNNTKILSIVEMSSVRKLVFKNATAPAIILNFQYNENRENLNNKILYTSLKPNIFFKMFNIIVIEKYDIKYVAQKLLLENDWAWKTIVYGFSRDVENIKNMKINYLTFGSKLQEKKFICGVGVEDQDGDQDASHLRGKYILPSESLKQFYINTKNMDIFDKEYIHRVRNSELFEAPFVITLTGVDCKNYKMKAAYSDMSFISRKAMYIIKGSDNQKKELNNIVALLNSSLYSYLNLMLGSSIGIEREQRLISEVLEFPYIYAEEISNQSEYISTHLNSDNKNQFLTIKKNDLVKENDELDNLIMDKFNLSGDKFIDYALNIQIPQLTNLKRKNIYREVTNKDLVVYSECFKNQFFSIYNSIGKNILITLYPKILNRFTIFELEITDNVIDNKVIFKDSADSNKEVFTKLIRHDYNDVFHQIKDVIHFSENSFYIIKPNYYKNWHPAIAEMDLADVLDQILSDDGGEE